METSELFIPVILGTGRQGRFTEKATQFINKQAQAFGFRTQLMDVRTYHQEITHKPEETALAIKDILRQADGFIIVAPEYNHGYPGELKLFLDQGYEEYNRKPIAICGVSNGGFGGVRMVEQLRLVCIGLQLLPIKNAVYFAEVEQLFLEDGTIAQDSYYTRTEKMLRELDWLAKALSTARSNH